VHVREELRDHAALAHTGLADDRHELDGALLHRLLEGADQKRLLELAADERSLVLTEIAAEAVTDDRRPPECQRLRLALRGDRLEGFVLEDVTRRPVRLLTNRDPVDRSRTLDTRRRVDDVAGDDALPLLRAGTHRDDRLAGIDANAHLQAEVGVGLVELRDRVGDAESHPHRALGVVLVRYGSAEHGHDRVSHELLDRAVVALDLLPQAGVVGTDAGAHVLRVLTLGRGGEAYEVAEEDGHDLSLLLRGGNRLLGQRGGAEGAEGKLARELLAAGRAGRHGRSLGARVGRFPRAPRCRSSHASRRNRDQIAQVHGGAAKRDSFVAFRSLARASWDWAPIRFQCLNPQESRGIRGYLRR
jgi:hypothetical protein